ncbi:hypothetical protein [Hyphomicrobium sp. D-2]|uniref:hypothetical protein n=1 Tax=Hyphomicrobium sp. D-2 TaxID=3041621 RepID=UPI002456394D|nr:hypothetical protein [Hyphomicrobium sp. D-2]MDH4981458.1 hypothetical protein [Hyphomicrobium sp. D-2]
MNPKSWPVPLWFGIILTALWLVISVAYLSQKNVWSLQPNEAGDLAAGISAPLAFLWLVVATFLQKEELSLQRNELRESREAQQKQARETENLVRQNMAAVDVAKSTLFENQQQWKEQQLARLIDSIGEWIVAIRLEALLQRGDQELYLLGYGSAEANEVIRRAVDALAYAMPLKANDSLENSALIQPALRKILSAIDAVLVEFVDEPSNDGKSKFPDIEMRVEFIKLRQLRRQIEELLMWLGFARPLFDL